MNAIRSLSKCFSFTKKMGWRSFSTMEKPSSTEKINFLGLDSIQWKCAHFRAPIVSSYHIAKQCDVSQAIQLISNRYPTISTYQNDTQGFGFAQVKNAQHTAHTYFFKNGTCVLWGMSEQETRDIMETIQASLVQYKPDELEYGKNGDKETLILYNGEMNMNQGERKESSQILHKGNLYLSPSSKNQLHQEFAISLALSSVVQLNTLEKVFDEKISHIRQNLNNIESHLTSASKIYFIGKKLFQSKKKLHRMRHSLNTSFDMTDSPDVLWEFDEEAILYGRVKRYFDASRRIEKLNNNLTWTLEEIQDINDFVESRYSGRLEWIIIILIGCELFMGVLGHAGLFHIEKKKESSEKQL